jgi:hypothetical protein
MEGLIMAEVNTGYTLSHDDILLHKDMVKKTAIDSYCHIKGNCLYITNPESYVECVNEYWKNKLFSHDVAWHTDTDVVQSVIDITDYLTGLSNETH